ncbi:hypothetical protein B0J12DRAFT_705632 [Macrophomina phaseolina]|uniref:Adenosine deaminase domain-containing protein n=1 Tax=Macrophomina phaseolina TaxID=35725 RepID=A0ABQ8FRE7_9PEZI|nr:hypothetical protein B0J12DRAFT_705632 [Macrophomina phaseolina]
MVSAEETLNEAIDHTWPWMRFNAHAELKDDRFSTNGRIEFKIEQWNEKKETQQIHDGIFNANEWVQVKSFLEQKFKGNRKDGIKCISEHLMVRPNRGWDQFSEITAVFKILITRHVFEWKFREVIRQCQRQLFSGIETRMMVFQKVGNDDGVGTIDIFEQLGILRAILKEQDDKEKEQTREDANHSHGEKHQKTDSRRVRISVVLATSRQFQLERMEEDFQKALECIEKYPDLITGFDVVGPESTQSCSSEQMYSFLKKAQHELRMLVDVEEYQSSHDVGLRLHAGESTVSYWSNFGLRLIHRPNSNVQMALDLGCKRISHFLAANDFQILQAKRQGVIIEACLITAQKLQAIDRIQDHPIHRWIDMGLKVAISPDNPSTYGCDFIDEFLYILWLGGPCCLWLLHNVIVNSIQGYLMGEEEEKRELAKFEADWTDWVKDSLKPNKYFVTAQNLQGQEYNDGDDSVGTFAYLRFSSVAWP